MEGKRDDDYSDYDNFPEKPKKKKEGPPTKADKAKRKQETQAAKEARAQEAEIKITKQISLFPDRETTEGREQAESYIKWLKESLVLRHPRFNPDDPDEVKIKAITSSVKAGGQNRQRNRTAIQAKHLPTLISTKNEDERSLEQNKQLALTALYKKLEEHLKLWQTVVESSFTQLDITAKIKSLIS